LDLRARQLALASACWDVPLIQHDSSRDVNGVPDRGLRADAWLEQRAELERVWTHIHALPVRQRHAVLLTLRDDAIGWRTVLPPQANIGADCAL
jgi:hypothetical protein